ncbi:MAG: hypothetical protein QOD41_3482 [Cryptosporangiaceae bacterium]|nr:hypothetical protein [Cryptosporangiaceae bacterium]
MRPPARIALLTTAIALVCGVAAAPASADPAGVTIRSLGDGRSRIVVPQRLPVPIRDAAPVVMDGRIPLGYGRIATDRRSVTLDTAARVTDPRQLTVTWTGGSLPSGATPAAPATGTDPAPPATSAPAPHPMRLAAPDPGLPGPQATTRAEYDLGDSVFPLPNGTKGELRGEVTYPAPLGAGKRPLIVLLHGRHSPCGRADGSISVTWPCPAGYRAIPSLQGYRALADLLASYGSIVVSISANAINATDDEDNDYGAAARAKLVIKHLELWSGWSGSVLTGPFGTTFEGKVDLTRVGLFGHSRGGEGVVAALAENKRTGSRFGIQAVVPLAPTDLMRYQLRGTPSLTVVPYCDGDVSDLQGVHYFDDATAAQADTVPHALLGVLGANHNYFNSVWTPGGWEADTIDDWDYTGDPANAFCGKGAADRLQPTQQLAAGDAYIAAFFRARLQSAPVYDSLFLGNTEVPLSAAPGKVLASYVAGAAHRRKLDDLRGATGLNALGGSVTATGFATAQRCGGGVKPAAACFKVRGPGEEPHVGPWIGPVSNPLAQQHLAWSAPNAVWSSAVPAAYRDVSAYKYLTIRLARDSWAKTDASPQVGVRLTDADGHTKTVPLTGPALGTPVYTGPDNNDAFGGPPQALVTGVPVILAGFKSVDLTRLTQVAVVGEGTAGNIVLADISFQAL